MTPSMKMSEIQHLAENSWRAGGIGFEEAFDRIREIVGEPEAKWRKIVRIATSQFAGVEGVYPPSTLLYALTDDGKLYSTIDDAALFAKGAASWQLIPDIPQDTPAESPDPIGELEKLGAILFSDVAGVVGWQATKPGGGYCVESIPDAAGVGEIRAAAARLLARVRGEK